MILNWLAKIYTAGSSFDEADQKIKRLLDQGFGITSDILGEFVGSKDDIERSVSEYKNHIFQIPGLSLALKPSRIGLEISETIFKLNLLRILAEAQKHKVFVWIDAEKKKDRDTVLMVVLEIHSFGYHNIGLAVQCVHSDAKDYSLKLLKKHIPVRLVKGAYTDGDLKKDTQITQNFKDCFWTACCYYKDNIPEQCNLAYIAVGTHDSKLIDYALAFTKDKDMGHLIQIQMLYGIRVKLQHELVRSGENVLVYVPWGSDASGFLKRRLAEGIRPRALLLFLRNIIEALRDS